VFANRTGVYVEVQVGAETLSPRVQVVSRAGSLSMPAASAGKVAGDFLDKSATAQTKSGLAHGKRVDRQRRGQANGVEGTTAAGAGVKGTATGGAGTNYGVERL
jgi:hypothetical protein